MNEHFGPVPPGPPPPPDGVSRAFRAADRRRLRTAAISSVLPVVLFVGLALPRPDRVGLEPTDPAVTETPGPSRSPGSPPALPGVEVLPPQGTAPGGTPFAPPSLATPTTVPTLLPPATPVPNSVTITGSRTSSGRLVTDTPLQMNGPAQLIAGGPGGTYGFFIESDDRQVYGGALHFPDGSLPGRTEGGWISFGGGYASLPAGAYTVWLVANGPTTLRLPTAASSPLLVRTAKPARTWHREVSGEGTVDDAVGTVEVRLPFTAPVRVAGVLSHADRLSGAGHTDLCVTPRGGSCTGRGFGGEVRQAGWSSSAIDPFDPDAVPPGEPTDVLWTFTGGAGTEAHATLALFLLYLE